MSTLAAEAKICTSGFAEPGTGTWSVRPHGHGEGEMWKIKLNSHMRPRGHTWTQPHNLST